MNKSLSRTVNFSSFPLVVQSVRIVKTNCTTANILTLFELSSFYFYKCYCRCFSVSFWCRRKDVIKPALLHNNLYHFTWESGLHSSPIWPCLRRYGGHFLWSVKQYCCGKGRCRGLESCKKYADWHKNVLLYAIIFVKKHLKLWFFTIFAALKMAEIHYEKSEDIWARR